MKKVELDELGCEKREERRHKYFDQPIFGLMAKLSSLAEKGDSGDS